MAKNMGAPPRRRGDKATFGIAEWYGRLYKNLSGPERLEFLSPETTPECPFLAAVPDIAPGGRTRCSKSGGVCSIRNFTETSEGIKYGPITSTCPNRFLEDRIVITEIGRHILNTDDALVAKEIPFLRRVSGQQIELDTEPTDPMVDIEESGDTTEDVGKIDLVFLHPENEPKEWCAVEMQAVYFSGGKMADDYKVIRTHTGNGVPMPGSARRPDFRSSGPKRLMPQLQIKVPSLRRWGKKMVVIIDKPFLDAMAPMSEVAHISNCDIVWVVVNYNEANPIDSAKLFVDKIIYTTLEDAVVGLTAGVPTTLPYFEYKLTKKILKRRTIKGVELT